MSASVATPQQRKIYQRGFVDKGYGVDDLERAMRYYLKGGATRLGLAVTHNGGMLIAIPPDDSSEMPVFPGHGDWDYNQHHDGDLNVRVVAAIVQNWLDHLTDEERQSLIKATPLEGAKYKYTSDEGFRISSVDDPRTDWMLRVLPALI